MFHACITVYTKFTCAFMLTHTRTVALLRSGDLTCTVRQNERKETARRYIEESQIGREGEGASASVCVRKTDLHALVFPKTYAYMLMNTYTYVYVHMCICKYSKIYRHYVYIHTYINTHAYTCVYTYIYTHL